MNLTCIKLQKISTHIYTLLLLSFSLKYTHTQHMHTEKLFYSLTKKSQACGGLSRDKIQ